MHHISIMCLCKHSHTLSHTHACTVSHMCTYIHSHVICTVIPFNTLICAVRTCYWLTITHTHTPHTHSLTQSPPTHSPHPTLTHRPSPTPVLWFTWQLRLSVGHRHREVRLDRDRSTEPRDGAAVDRQRDGRPPVQWGQDAESVGPQGLQHDATV